jgi:hypothetical protein
VFAVRFWAFAVRPKPLFPVVIINDDDSHCCTLVVKILFLWPTISMHTLRARPTCN